MVIKISLVATTEVVSSAFKLLAQERICLSNSMSVQLKFSQAIFADHQLYCLFLQARVVTCAHTLVAKGKLRSEDWLYIIRCSEQFEQVYSIRWNVKLLQLPWLHIHITMNNNNSKLSKKEMT